MTALARLWRTAPCDESAAAALAVAAGVPMPLARVLASRGLAGAGDAADFLAPRLSTLGDPFRLPAMDAAVARLWAAVERGEIIVVYGDYDVDGITSAVLLLKVLRALGAKAEPFLPHRVDEGYGLSPDALDRCLAEKTPALIVTVDCGTGSAKAVDVARRRGIDVIVTDHHTPAGEIADALAVVNPKVAPAGADASLAGVGVAFKLCHALIKRGRERGHAEAERIDLKDHLDLVALGTVADIVPLRDENRVLARFGLDRLNRTGCLGLRTLVDVAGIAGRIDAYEVGFRIGPRLNAAGRLGDALDALELLMTDDPNRARELAVHLDATNRDRQALEGHILDEASKEIEGRFDPARDFALVVARRGWHPGVIGIVASRIAGRFNRPVAVVAVDDEGVGRGSCRSIEDFDLVAHLGRCASRLLKFGGHAMAAGLEVREGDLPAFREELNAAAAATLRGRDLRPVQRIDAWMDLGDADMDLVAALDRMRPFGCGNPTPVFACAGVRILGRPKAVGRNQEHLKMTVTAGGAQRDTIGFGLAGREIPEGPLDIAVQVRKDVYQGRETLSLHVQDFRPHEPVAATR